MRLTKSSYDKVFAGICGGIAEYFGWNPTLVRIAFVLTGAFTLYLILYFIMPDDDTMQDEDSID